MVTRTRHNVKLFVYCLGRTVVWCGSPFSRMVSSRVVFSIQKTTFHARVRITTGTNKGFVYTGRFIMFSVITNIYNKKTKGPILMELFTATGKLIKFFFDN